MRVSVVIPLYNKAPYIGRALDSALAQTFADFEVIVVDDGSTDGGGEVVAARGDRRVRLIAQANAGPGAARNRGLSAASGEYISFLDADDEWLPGFLAASVARLDGQGPEVAAACSGYFEFPSGRSTEPLWRRRRLTDGVHRLGPGTRTRFAVHLMAYMSPWSTLLRADAVRRWGGFFDRRKCLYGEDSFLWLKVLLNESVVVGMEPLVRYHTEASALSRRLRGPRPIEPMLTDPEEIEAACPDDLRGLLRRVLALRALKTACRQAAWGRWRDSRALLTRFAGRRASMSCSTGYDIN